MTETELDEPEVLASLNDHDYLSPIRWPELLQHPRVLLLAEAGSGKTREMQEQAKRLVGDGKHAFFVPLESLDQSGLSDLLSPEDEHRFASWKIDDRVQAWFFLDAVDELKLNQGKLDRALRRFAKDINGFLARVHVVISCRPTDWRQAIDMSTLEARLPIVPAMASAPPSADEAFIAALHEEQNMQEPEEATAQPSGVRTVVLLPMSDHQIKMLALGLGVTEPAAFISEIRKQNAWTFARRPLDCSELVAAWRTSGQLGTRAQQHESNTAFKLKDDPERPDSGVLSDTQARLGAERLALALALTRTRTIRAPEWSSDANAAEGVLDSAKTLPDWTEEKRRTLLRRALFDPATYGRVRFHHRSVQEYLAASRLKNLREKGMSTKALFRLLFAENYGVSVVIPSMQAIAAWLALWNDDVRRELMAREPEILLSEGDPESFPVNARRGLIRAFAKNYGEGGWRGLNIPIGEVRRLAHPELSDTIREIWGNGTLNEDVRELLLELIWKGANKECADIAENAAMNPGYSAYERIIAVNALVVCSEGDAARRIADSVIKEPEKWPDRAVRGIASNLFPHTITVEELVALVERTHEPESSASGFSWTLREIAADIAPWSAAGVQLRNNLADLIWRGRLDKQEFYRIIGRYDYVAPALGLLCDRQLSIDTATFDDDLLRACVIANRFGDDEIGGREPIEKLKQHFADNLELRKMVFWLELDFMDEVVPEEIPWQRFYHTQHGSVVGNLTESDRPWLEAALAAKCDLPRRSVALQALITLWALRGRLVGERDFLRKMVIDDAGLAEVAAKSTDPIEPNPESERFERESRQRRAVHEKREQQRLEDWKAWRNEVLAAPDIAFQPENLGHTLANLHDWLAAYGRRSRYNVWNQEALGVAFGSDLAQRAATAFQSFWRTHPPILWSDRPVDERSTVLWDWAYGLSGIASESGGVEWAQGLTRADARTAAAFATVELNGFPSWFTRLVAAHPDDVDAVVGAELTAELALGGEHQYLPALQDLSHADHSVKQLFAPRCLAALTDWPSELPDETLAQHRAHQLNQVLGILNEVSVGQDRVAIAGVCHARFTADHMGPLALVWLRGLFQSDPRLGTGALVETLAAINTSARTKFAVEWFTALFGERDGLRLDVEVHSTRVEILTKLVRCVYNHIRPEDDYPHEGSYTPNARDKAERARDYLLSALLNTPGVEARIAILALATEPDFQHMPDRLRFLARRRAAADAEFAAYDASDVQAIEARFEAPPHDRDGLFAVMIDRLDDLSHDIAHDDFTDRQTLRTIKEEIEMQRTLARRLRDSAKGAYTVSREDEVADQKRTDIRLASVRSDQKAVIEVKIADKRWSLSELESALRSQLVGQYLRHDGSKAGCLLLTYDGEKNYWKHPETRAHMNFREMVDFLEAAAEEMEREQNYGIRLKVYGLDLTDPILTAVLR
ncbi:hypothetical protein [Thiobacillus sp.]|uniref:hypothetical protein n=1 Tax=Thiobacillus sp. TaxID=924 RepID=UPI00286E020B|nr:hypothetical protein [Thiobacillus sp.]